MFLNRIVFGVAAAWMAALPLQSAAAQDFPSRPVKIVVPNPPGGPGDVIARAFTERMGKGLSQPFILEYRPGASTTIGAQAVVKSDPDGHTILALPSAGLAITVLRKKLSYNLEKDLRPVVGVGSVPLALIVRSSLGFKSVDDLAAAIRKGDLFYGSGGIGTVGHLTGLLLLAELKGSATHVPYAGNPEVMQAILSGSNDLFFGSVSDAMAFAKTPQVQIFGVTSAARVTGLETVPTLTELGLPKVNSKLWYAFLAPSQTPTDRVMRLHDIFANAAKNPDLQHQLAKVGFNVEIRNPDQLAVMMREEAARWKQLVDANNISIND